MKRFSLLLRFLVGLPKSIYLNFKALPFSQAIYLPLFVSINTKIDGCFKKSIEIKSDRIRFAMISLGIYDRSPGLIFPKNCYIGIDSKSKIIFKGSFAMCKGGCLKVSNGGIMECGDCVTFNSHSKVLCSHDIKIGNNVRLGWETMLKDGDGHAICDESGEIFNGDRPISIGNNVWVGAEVALLKGASIADDSVVGFRSVVTKRFDTSHVIIAGNPGKVVKEKIKWISD